MADHFGQRESGTRTTRRPRPHQRARLTKSRPINCKPGTNEVDVGLHLRHLRTERNISIRSLADQSGLNANTLSLIENGKTSPSVSTLLQVANALKVPITAFFESNYSRLNVSYQKDNQRSQAAFAHGTMADLKAGSTTWQGQPFLVTLEPKTTSGPRPIVHTGHEFVYCLEGQILYTVENSIYQLDPGDSLVFEAFLPHCWQNAGDLPARTLLLLCPADESDRPTEQHFVPSASQADREA